MNDDRLPEVALIAGPTASGKSALAMTLAERRDGVVINADSVQVYTDLRVLSARPSATDERRVPHRLFGYVDGAEHFSAARWAVDACAAIAEAHVSGKLPILVGGTGLYLRTLFDGIAPVPEIPDHVRDEIRALEVAEAHALLADVDPGAAARLNPQDTTRIARALEVVRGTGRTLADWQTERHGGIGGQIALNATILLPDRDWLMGRCDRRLEAMFEDDAAGEVERLLARRDVSASAPVRRAIGVFEIGEMLAGRLRREEALTNAKLATRQYAKRQYTWFRNQPPPTWQRVINGDCDKILAH